MKAGDSLAGHRQNAEMENYEFLMSVGESHEQALTRSGMNQKSYEQRRLRKEKS